MWPFSSSLGLNLKQHFVTFWRENKLIVDSHLQVVKAELLVSALGLVPTQNVGIYNLEMRLNNQLFLSAESYTVLL